MDTKVRFLLALDAAINLIIGIILLLFPIGITSQLGLPVAGSYFYPTILGGVLLGIGIALLIEWKYQSRDFGGLGLVGAIAINLCGGAALLYWLLSPGLNLPVRGRILLWLVDILVLGIGLVELFGKPWKSRR